MLTSYCTTIGQAGGSLTWLWRRPLSADGRPTGRWERVGLSCNLPGDVVEKVAGPVVTAAMIRRAFRDLPLTPPTTHVQPEGNTTLVNLATYYAVTWPGRGYRPGEVATVTLLGRTVRIRPAAGSFTYSFGDGHRLGPTSDAGGTYPDGGITHTYLTRATVPVSVRASYTGQYSLDGSNWQDIDLTIPITGPVTTVRVREARARLVADP